MARFAQILQFTNETPIKIAGLAATTASAAQFIGNRRIIAINADQDIMVLTGNSGVGAPTAANYRIPQNQQTTIDMGANAYIRVFNNGSSAANIYIAYMEGR